MHTRNAHILANAIEARCNTVHVAIHRGLAQAEGDAADGSGCIGANARQGKNLLVAGGEYAAMLVHNDLGGLLQVACAAVIAQALPGLQYLSLRRLRKRLNGGKAFKKTGIVAFYRFHARLLQHNFRQPDTVGVFGAPPGQVALYTVVPVQQQLSIGRRHPAHSSFRSPLL